MTQVGRLIMLKTQPFYSVIRAFELRNMFADVIGHFNKGTIPNNRIDLTLDNAKWFLSTGHKNFKRGTALTCLMEYSKEYISIANAKASR